ncbi:MAG: phosphoglycerate mutase (2,3-diphosphoglycerate-independent), partial [Desulfuromonadales bacterium]|nr:phosphoglycerate mutase (2,3-diphosphoglycerate-independent) [Desulfuromonadales bacterium]
MRKPVALIILDGWGISENCANNAVCQAQTPFLDELANNYPTSWLNASGLNVGLPDGQMGNSEVGHLNIGAGRIIHQDLTRISHSIETGDFSANPTLLDALKRIRNANGKLHLLGLLSDGGVHSHNTHLYALIELAKHEGVEACVHAFMDGRDTPPQSGADYLLQLEAEMARMGHGRLASVIGRYYAMDRDNRWDRVQRAWQAMALGQGHPTDSSAAAIQSAYTSGQTDEFIEPRVIQKNGLPVGRINDNDGIIFFNFRADRAREITRTFTERDFAEF